MVEILSLIMSPIRRVPMDIIRQTASHLADRNWCITLQEPAWWNMSRACSSWNQALTSHAPLWSNFTVGTSAYGCRWAGNARLLEQALRLGGDHPLNFIFHIDELSREFWPANIDRLLDLPNRTNPL